jgi:hypothetical protein
MVRRLSGAARLKDKKGKKLRWQFRPDIRISAQLLAPLFFFFVFFPCNLASEVASRSALPIRANYNQWCKEDFNAIPEQ